MADPDLLGLRRVSGAGLPVAVAAMAFVASLAVAAEGAARTVETAFWATGDRARTVLVPDSSRLDDVMAALRGDAGVAEARALGDAEVVALVRPWLGQDMASAGLPMPGVVAVVLRPGATDFPVTASLAGLGATVADQDGELAITKRIADGLRALAGGVLVAIGVAAGILVAVATRATLLFRRETIEIAHGLGADDGWIVGRLAGLGAARAAIGAGCGVLVALPPLAALAWFAPALSGASSAGTGLTQVPLETWFGLLGIPVVAALIGRTAASVVARGWLRRLT